MARPIALDVRDSPLTSAMETRIVTCTNADIGSVQIMEPRGKRWEAVLEAVLTLTACLGGQLSSVLDLLVSVGVWVGD